LGQQVKNIMANNSDASSGSATAPASEEVERIVTLLNQGHYTEGEAIARRQTEHFPHSGVSWKILGAVLKLQGRIVESLEPMRRATFFLPMDAGAHSNLGVTLNDLGRLEDAEASFRRALEIQPDYVEAYFYRGNIFRGLDRLEEAEASYRHALEIKPELADAHLNLGLTLKNMGRMEEAEASYRCALEFDPDFVMAHYNLGNTLSDLGRLEEAEASYRYALKIKPDLADAHLNLGVTLKNMGRLEEAEASYRGALRIKPDYVEALNNLASLYYVQGLLVIALNTIRQSVQIKESEEAKSIFVACVKQLRLTHDDSEIRAIMVRALTEPWAQPAALARVGIEMLRLNPDIEVCIARTTSAWPLRLSLHDLFGANGLAIFSADPLMCAILISAPICGIEMEHFLTMARWSLLDTATRLTSSAGEIGTDLRFFSALARQCFINEYVFSYTDDEIKKAGDLRDSLVAALECNTQVPVLWPVVVAAYFPLCSLPLAVRLLDRQWPEPVADLLLQQIREPEKEMQERAGIPRLTSIEDEVSLLVQRQYEENPYPRWVKIPSAGKAKDLFGYFSRRFPLASFKRHCKNNSVDILIAGCGTGQHSIGTAQQFQGARVLAVDLSINSLGYAKRKTCEMGLNSIEYAQADLLKLGSLGRSFDVVDSSGVLHHLADPWVGWNVLLSLLHPGGFMRLGFYSEVARRDIVRIRTFIAEQGYGATASDIRRCRQDLMALDKDLDFGNILRLLDFFSVSSCRDLLFHVQEHRVTLTSIDAFIRNNNLVFLGFEIDRHVMDAYKERFPDDRTATNLAQWQTFENENPDTFFGMYQFWIQKRE
jgi:tetratricopeptide (TPR) repeat protein/2-polyprenyl-3-methyl-5-hydroxy-6-metoxy-1,4-benzoquinol methylase